MEIRDSEVLKNLYRKAVILSVAMAGGIIVLPVIAEFVIASQAGFHGFAPELAQGVLPYALWGVAMLALATSRVLPAQLLLPKASPRANAMQLLLPQVRHQRMLQALLVGCALSEAAAVIGLVGFLLMADRVMFYTLWGLGLLFLKLNLPSLQRWQELAHQVGRMR